MIREERAKAKVATTNHSSHQDYEQQLSLLRAQVKEKEKEVDHFKKSLEESREASEREQRLMTSAVYDMGLQLQRLNAPKPMLSSQSDQPKSLLAQKRRELNKN